MSEWVNENRKNIQERILITLLESKKNIQCYCGRYFLPIDVESIEEKNESNINEYYTVLSCKSCTYQLAYWKAIKQIKNDLLHNDTSIRVSETILNLVSDCKIRAEANSEVLLRVLIYYIKSMNISSPSLELLESLK